MPWYRCVRNLGRRWRQVPGSEHDLFRDMFPTCRKCEKWTWTVHICQVFREAIKKRWISWAGNPDTVQCDSGLHNRGILAQYMGAHGIQVYPAPLETPEAIGRVEHHGGVLKDMVIAQTQARGEVEIQSVLDESCLTKNNLLRNGGYFHLSGCLVRHQEKHHLWCLRMSLQTSVQ